MINWNNLKLHELERLSPVVMDKDNSMSSSNDELWKHVDIPQMSPLSGFSMGDAVEEIDNVNCISGTTTNDDCLNLYAEGICSEYFCAFMIGKSAFADAGADKSDPKESWYALVSADNFLILKASNLTLDLKHTLRKRYSHVCA